MVASIIVVTLIGFLSLFFGKVLSKEKPYKILFLVLCGTIIVLQMGLRNATIQLTPVYDVRLYYEQCLEAERCGLIEYLSARTKDYGFYTFNWLVAHIFHSGQVLLFLVALIICFFTFRFIYKYSPNIYLSALLFVTLGFYGFSLTGFRQSIAISLCLWAYDFAKKRKIIPFVLIVLLAGTIHQTSIIFLCVYALGWFKLNAKDLLIVFFICLAVFLLGNTFIGLFNSLFHMHYEGYQNSSILGRVLRIIIYGIIFVLLFFAKQNQTVKSLPCFSERLSLLTFILMVGGTCYLLSFRVQAMERISFYFTNSIVYVAIPNITSSFKNKKFAFFLDACFAVFSIALFLSTIYRNNLYEFAYII